jgi:hypothetical protein
MSCNILQRQSAAVGGSQTQLNILQRHLAALCSGKIGTLQRQSCLLQRQSHLCLRQSCGNLAPVCGQQTAAMSSVRGTFQPKQRQSCFHLQSCVYLRQSTTYFKHNHRLSNSS